MSLISITTGDPDSLAKAPEFPVISPGKHLFVVANRLTIETTQGDQPKSIIKLEARCQDETDEKGMPVFENFLIISPEEAASDPKLKTTKDINDPRLAQFVASCGVATMEQIKHGEQFDISDCYEKNFMAITKVTQEEIYPQELDENGKPKKAPRARIKQFLFEPTAS